LEDVVQGNKDQATIETAGSYDAGYLKVAASFDAGCHTHFLCQNQVLIVCMLRINCSTHTDKKCSQITKCYE
jgi:hypothetical protein